MAHDPLSPDEALRTRLGLVLVVLAVFILVYAMIIVNQLLVGFWFVVSIAGLYLWYRVIAVLDSFAMRFNGWRPSARHRSTETVNPAATGVVAGMSEPGATEKLAAVEKIPAISVCFRTRNWCVRLLHDDRLRRRID